MKIGLGHWGTYGIGLVALLAAAAGPIGCGGERGKGFVQVTGADAGSTEGTEPTLATGGDGGDGLNLNGPFTDFPAAPIVDDPSLSKAFDGVVGSSSGGPCLAEPEIGSIYPRNWLRPRFRWLSAGLQNAQNAFELRVHVKNQTNDLVVITGDDRWTMPKTMWDALRTHSAGEDMTVSIRGGHLSSGGATVTGAAIGSTGPIGVAPVDAPGTIVYWTTGTSSTPGQGTGTALKGFRIGDEAVADVLKPTQVPVNCVACHSSTPDGAFVGMSVADSPGSGNVSRIELRAVDGSASEPSWLTGSAKALLQRTGNQLPVFSKSHYTTGDRIALSILPVAGKAELIWTDLETTSQDQGTGWGIIARTGDTQTAGTASLSHDGNSIVYASATSVGAATIFTNGDLYQVPYNNRQGGAATPVAGASTTQYNEFQSSYSPDDHVIAFARAPNGTTSYNNVQSEIMVIPASGGTATRLKANDPPVCTQVASPGITNSWPKWSPEVKTADGNLYYFLVFSSTRHKGATGPQLYVTPVVVEPSGAIRTFGALYLWNQPENENNHTPSWDSFAIPPVPPPGPK